MVLIIKKYNVPVHAWITDTGLYFVKHYLHFCIFPPDMLIILNLILCIITPPNCKEDLFLASGYDDLLAQCHDSK